MNFLLDAKTASKHSRSNVSFVANVIQDIYIGNDSNSKNDIKSFSNQFTSTPIHPLNISNSVFYETYLNSIGPKIFKKGVFYEKTSNVSKIYF
uniref:Uncharacterized protein n=1 Tax=Parastrongyloides trichosuri TaxID=131310 RepID=A0A0N4ZS51_PARTI